MSDSDDNLVINEDYYDALSDEYYDASSKNSPMPMDIDETSNPPPSTETFDINNNVVQVSSIATTSQPSISLPSTSQPSTSQPSTSQPSNNPPDFSTQNQAEKNTTEGQAQLPTSSVYAYGGVLPSQFDFLLSDHFNDTEMQLYLSEDQNLSTSNFPLSTVDANYLRSCVMNFLELNADCEVDETAYSNFVASITEEVMNGIAEIEVDCWRLASNSQGADKNNGNQVNEEKK